MSHRTSKGWIVAGLLIAVAAALRAGPLNPPSGPVASTYKTLSEVEPRTAINATNTPGDANSLFKITASGSYYLTGNITGVSGKYGIGLAASHITIDLNGFEVVGVAGALDGIKAVLLNLNDVTIRNGTIRDWPSDGINALNSGTGTITGGLYEGLHVSGNRLGIRASDNSIIRGCTADANTQDGLFVNAGGLIERCTSHNNAMGGVSFGTGNRIVDCVCTGNGQDGIGGTGHNCIERCLADGNAVGIHVSQPNNFIDSNTVTGNTTTGIKCDNIGSVIVRNLVAGSPALYSVVAGNSKGPSVTSANIATSTSPHGNYEP